jgi:putative ABC transport system substrate-binding protein
MRRRWFLATLVPALAVAPRAVRGQSPPAPVVGFLNGGVPGPFAHLAAGFRKGLAEAGYTEGRDVVIEYRWADGRYARLPALAAELVRLKVGVIVATGGENSALAAREATATIPIVFAIGGDPVAAGLVTSLNRPGGNLTGVTQYTGQLEAKRLGLLREALPTATSIPASRWPPHRSGTPRKRPRRPVCASSPSARAPKVSWRRPLPRSSGSAPAR